jgi:ribosomal protein L31
MTRLLVIATLFCFAAPAAFAAPPSGQGQSGVSAPTPSQLCKQQLQTMGAVGFQSTYAPNGNAQSAMGKCISRQAQQAQGNADNAAKACKKERADNVADFNKKYGTPNSNLKNAFGKCVSGKAKKEAEDDQENTLNAAKACKKERADNVADFNKKYGTPNSNLKNAFGKCVSTLAKAQGSSSLS